MSTGAAITLGITIAGFLGGILWKVVEVAVKNGKLQQRLDTMEAQQEKTDAKNSAKFEKLYNLVNVHGSAIDVLTSVINTVKDTTERTESKLDRLIEREARNED